MAWCLGGDRQQRLRAVGAKPADRRLTPGQNLEAIVAHAPEGTRFRFEPGIYRQQTIRPKTGRSSKDKTA